MGDFDLKEARRRVAQLRGDLMGAGVEWKHVKSGGLYWVETIGLREADGAPLVVYRDSDGVGTCWIRPADEFCDGRFVRTSLAARSEGNASIERTEAEIAAYKRGR